MKYLLILVTLLVSASIFAQNQKLNVKGYFPYDFPPWFIWKKPDLISMDSDTTIKGVIKNDKLVYYVGKGKYLFTQCSVFGRCYSDTIKVESPKRLKHIVKASSTVYNIVDSDSMLSTKITIGDTLKVWFLSIGCFHYHANYLFITRQDSSKYLLSMSLREEESKTAVVDGKVLEKIFDIEQEASKQKGGCTTRRFYSFNLNSSLKQVVDGNCGSNSFYQIYEEIFEGS